MCGAGAPVRQSGLRRACAMLRALLFILLTQHTRTAYVTEPPTFVEKLDELYEKLNRLSVAPVTSSPEENLYAKINKLNSLSVDKVELGDEDEELLSAMQDWGMLSGAQMEKVVKDLQMVKDDFGKSERLVDGEYGDPDWIDGDLQDIGEGEYAMDSDWEGDYDTATKAAITAVGVTPSSFTRLEGYQQVVSAVDAISATNERPRILDDSSLTPYERSAFLQAALAHIRSTVRAARCLVPQPRWLSLRQLAPAADTVYMPPCVQLHRCAPDAGCCSDEAEVCAPVDGKHVTIPFYLSKADGNLSVARMVFFNHTRCACVSHDTLTTTVRSREIRTNQVARESLSRETREGQNDWRSTEGPRLERDEEQTAAPQLRRCTCPGLFQARTTDSACTCVCEWHDITRRRDCLSLARGREHFGLRDRVCVINGDCTPPTCEYGTYEKSSGRCPLRRSRRAKYHQRTRSVKSIL